MFTDGACSGNPGPGGWGVLLRSENGTTRELNGGEPATTNNRMELMAVIEGLRALKRKCVVTIYTDAKYVLDGFEKWLPNWVKNGWKSGSGPVKNQDLWEALQQEARRHELTWVWVKGHAGHPENERADALARAGVPHNR